jgi:hypothetical protein
MTLWRPKRPQIDGVFRRTRSRPATAILQLAGANLEAWMDTNVAYMPTVGKIPEMLDKIQNAGAPEVFNLDFLSDLGFTSSNDRSLIRVLKYLGMLDSAGRPQSSYREFLDHTKAKAVMAARLRAAYDDLFLADKDAPSRGAGQLKGWFKTKTGSGDAVAEKMASTFKAFADYADWAAIPPTPAVAVSVEDKSTAEPFQAEEKRKLPTTLHEGLNIGSSLGLVYRLEIHLPDSQNIDTFRAIFRALREELT